MTTTRKDNDIFSSRVGSMTNYERDDVNNKIRIALLWGYSDMRAAEYAGVCNRTVLRYRKKHGIVNNFTKRLS